MIDGSTKLVMAERGTNWVNGRFKLDKNDVELLDIEIEIKLLNTENSKAKQTFMTSDVNHCCRPACVGSDGEAVGGRAFILQNFQGTKKILKMKRKLKIFLW